MEIIFIPAKTIPKPDESIILEISKKLPDDIAIAYSIQYKETARDIKKMLERKGDHRITSFIQVLGCSKPRFPKNTKAVILVSDGRFHAVSLALETGIDVYLFDNTIFSKVNEKEISDMNIKKKAAYLRFLSAGNIGIIASAKPGQQNLDRALELKKSLKGKKAFIFIADNINTIEFENFQEVQSWVNTACPRMDFNDPRIVNIGEIEEYARYDKGI